MKELLQFSWNERYLELADVQRDATAQFCRTGAWAVLWLFPFTIPAVICLLIGNQPSALLRPKSLPPCLAFWSMWFFGITFGRAVLFDVIWRKVLGRPFRLWTSTLIGLRRGLPLMVTLPFNGLTAPWSLAGAVAVIEGFSVRPALKRSQALTQGASREIWKYSVRRSLPILPCLYLGSVLNSWAAVTIQVAVLLLGAAYRTHVDVILYFHLRRFKEGLATVEEVAAQFD